MKRRSREILDKLQAASCKLQAASCKLQAASCKLQAASCKHFQFLRIFVKLLSNLILVAYFLPLNANAYD
jgi:hypothetical protein